MDGPLEEGEIRTTTTHKLSSRGGVKNKTTVGMKKSKSSKSAELDSKMALGQTHEPSSSKIHLRGVHGRISLREMKKAARLKASWLGPAKSLAVQHQIGQIGSAGTIRREKSSSIGSASKGGSITTPRVEL